MLVIMYGSINQAKLAWDIGDLGVGLMAWFNISYYLVAKPALLALRDYEKQKERKDPVFDPRDIELKCTTKTHKDNSDNFLVTVYMTINTSN
jgi:AGCS family alanine or glycine:cation symporter